MRLVIAEKPSVARDLARVLGAKQKRRGYLEGNGLRVSWCFGHMCALQDPDHYDPAWKPWRLQTLPMMPERFALKVRDGAADQFAILKRLLLDSAHQDVVNACDAGREGELIFRYVYEQTGSTLPVMRLWVSSLTDQAIQQGWKALRPGTSLEPLADAARSRSEADWLVGLNATRALTCRTRENGPGALLSLGRVQTPTLAMIVARDQAIANFVSAPFWRVRATFGSRQGIEPDRWVGWWFDPAVKENRKRGNDEEEGSHAERRDNEADAVLIRDAVRDQVGKVVRASRKRTTEKPPLLYDLTALQRRANQRYGLSAQRTLEVAQALYEQHKLITYPRTDARYLTPDQVPELPDVVRGLQGVSVYQAACAKILAGPISPGKRVVNAAEVGDHHAILPTGRDPMRLRLSADEKRVFDLVARRFLAALSPNALFDVTELVAEVPAGGPLPENLADPLKFRARGKVCRQQGWREIDPPKKSAEVELPAVDVEDPAPVLESATKEGQTRPPKPHTDASILRAMETAGKHLTDRELARALRGSGLGTPATRASILQTLLDRKYVRRDKKALLSTDRGRSLIEACPVDALKSAELTGRWEGRLTDIAEGRGERAAFMRDVRDATRDWVEAIAAAPAPEVEPDAPRFAQGRALGECPACSKPVRQRGTVWSCDTGRACPFVVFETMARRKISERMVKQLLKDGRTATVKNFKSRQGKPFDAALQWDADQGKVKFLFDRTPKPKSKPASGGSKRPTSGPEGTRCPECTQGTIIRGRTAFGCDRWRDGCSYRIPFQQ